MVDAARPAVGDAEAKIVTRDGWPRPPLAFSLGFRALLRRVACGILDAAIAEDAGGDWPARAREAVLELASGDGDDDDSILLLAKLRDAFTAGSAITSRKLVQFVRGDEELPFGELNPTQLAAMLKPYGIRLRTVRADDATSTAT